MELLFLVRNKKSSVSRTYETCKIGIILRYSKDIDGNQILVAHVKTKSVSSFYEISKHDIFHGL